MKQTKFCKKITPNKNSKTILGFDCSSSTIGWGQIDFNGFLNAYGYIKPLKSDNNLFLRLFDVFENIKNLCFDINPDYIVIEDVLLFMKGKSSANTINVLTAFNRTVGLSAYIHTGVIPETLSIHTIRKEIKNKCGLSSKIQKEELPNIIRDNLCSNFDNILNTRGNVANETYDIGDGIAVAWAYYIIMLRKIYEKSI
jgi:hypothetical protein